MTLQELSPQYARQAETVARRLRELRQQELAEGDPQAAQTLRQRQQELRPLLREARELGINKSTVSRTLSNSTMKLYRSLRYSL